MNFALYMGHLRGGGSQWCNRLHKGPMGPQWPVLFLGKKGRREGRALEDYDSNRAIICATCRARPRRRSPFAELPTAAERATRVQKDATRVQRGDTRVRRDAAEVRRRS